MRKILAGCLIGMMALPAFAHAGAEGIVKDRMEMMKSLGGALKAVGAMGAGMADLDQNVALNSSAVLQNAAMNMKAMFPDGTGHAPSRAKSTIWTDPAGFDAAIAAFAAGADNMAAAALANDDFAFMEAFGQVRKSCGSCHDGYRLPKE